MDKHVIAGGGLSGIVTAQGAELNSLRDDAGHEYMWQAGPVWPRHAPVMFPICGRLKGDTLRHNGRDYRMTQHGFARDRRFEWAATGPDFCTLTLTDDPATREQYPFAFRFTIEYRLDGDGLLQTFTITNTGDVVLPASTGGHPAFNWPLDASVPKNEHVLEFSDPEPENVRTVSDGLLTPANLPSPVIGKRLPLSPSLFAGDLPIIFEAPHSRSATLRAGDKRWLKVATDGFPQLVVWTREIADFLCVEAWAGLASPADFDGEFALKPWLMLIEPGLSRTASFQVSVGTS